MAKRRKGLRGSVFYKSGSLPYVVSFPLPPEADERDPDTGKRLYRKLPWERYPDEDSAYARLLELNTLYRSGSFVPPEKQTIGQYLEEWLATRERDVERGELRASTLERYRYAVKPAARGLRDVPLARLDRLHIQRWHAWMVAEGYSSYQQREAHTVLSAALNAALRARRIQFNACREAPAPKHAGRKGDAMSVEEVNVFLAYVKGVGHRQQVVIAPLIWDVMLETGIRGGEALALRWQHIDLEHAELAIDATLTKVDGRFVIGDGPKTEAGRRRIPITDGLVARLRAHKAEQNEARLRLGSHWQDNDLVFPRKNGAPILPSNLWQRFKRVCRTLGLSPRYSPHSLRHTAATLMLERGVPWEVVRDILGHENIATTLGVYGHVSTKAKRDAIAGLRRLLDGTD